jgi:NADH-quinone oxidoreductase subunit M
MSVLFALVETAVLALWAWLAARSSSSRLARRTASAGMGLATLLAAAQLLWLGLGGAVLDWSASWTPAANVYPWVPAFTFISCLIGFMAVVLQPLRGSAPMTFSRILLLVAVSVLFLALRNPAWLATLWAVSALLVWIELRRTAALSQIARVFGVYHGLSVVAVAVGAALLDQQHTAAALALILLGVAIREAVIPLQSWFPPFVQHAPMGLVVAFFAPQLGVYAHLELIGGHLPQHLSHGVAAVGAVTAVLAAALGVAQSDARRALAYLVMSQTGLVAFGLDVRSTVAQVGALLTWQVIGVATAAFAMTLASLESRRGSLSLDSPNGNFTRTPRMGVAFLVTGFASVGLPMTLGFVAEDLLVQGSVREFPILAFALITATALNGISVMRAFFVLFSGSSTHRGECDLTRRESTVLTLAMAMLLLSGLFPSVAVERLEVVPPSLSGAAQSPQLVHHHTGVESE